MNRKPPVPSQAEGDRIALAVRGLLEEIRDRVGVGAELEPTPRNLTYELGVEVRADGA